MAVAPSINNYYVGKGTVAFTPEGGTITQLGNCPEFEFTPSIETLDHFSSQSGVKSKDRSVTVQKGGTLRIVMDEFSEENLRIAFMGGATDGVTGAFPILEKDEIRGLVTFTGTNTVGPKVTVSFPLVAFKPSAAINLISDEWGQIEISGEVLISGGSFGTVEYAEQAA